MIFISHRGNLDGPQPAKENSPEYIDAALSANFDVEIDVWFIDGELYLGHDSGLISLPKHYLQNQRIWFHCKNIGALDYLKTTDKVKYFWHQEDDYTLTSNRKIWTYPGKFLMPGAIAVLPEKAYKGILWDCHAICTDFVYEFKRLYETRYID
jgi:hypothetical protein